MDLKNKLTEYQLFPRKYFSGSDVYIVIGNTVVEEIKSLEIELTQQVAFLYGYASYTADATAYGARMVNGKFTVNFRESGYLMSILGQANQVLGKSTETTNTITKPEAGYASNANYIAGLVKNGNEDKLKSTMQYQEDLIWGKKSLGAERNKYYEPTLLPLDGNKKTRIDGFDIIISYGDAGFHVGDTIGEMPSTVEVINGVFLSNSRKIIEPTGDNIMEEYTFIAKDFNNTINSKKIATQSTKLVTRSTESIVSGAKTGTAMGIGTGVIKKEITNQKPTTEDIRNSSGSTYIGPGAKSTTVELY